MDTPEKPRSWLRRILPWAAAVVLVAAVYDGSIFYSRRSLQRDAERKQAQLEAEQARKTLDLLGGNGLRIVSFYASPGVVRPGGHANLCYGVTGAKKVRLEPPVEEVWPSFTHCLQVAPRKDTAYKLIAEDGAGHTVSESLVLRVTR